jgi:transcriptional regulator with XRE-family HTH domain
MARYAIPIPPESSADRTQKLFRIQIGAVLQKQRLRQGLTQVEVAEHADLSLKYIGEIERGAANVSVDIIARIADAIGLNQADLLQPVQEPLSEGVRDMLVTEAQTMRERLGYMVTLLRALEPSSRRAINVTRREEPEKSSRARASRKTRDEAAQATPRK